MDMLSDHVAVAPAVDIEGVPVGLFGEVKILNALRGSQHSFSLNNHLSRRNTGMKFRYPIIKTLLMIGITVGSFGCSDSTTDPPPQEPRGQGPGFTASVSGAVNLQISEEGIVTYLPPKTQSSTMRVRPGYFLLANNLLTNSIEGKSIMITFRIPDGAQPGDYHLNTPDLQRVGEHFDVQVEAIDKGEPISFYTNTEGTITLEEFFPDRTYPDFSNIKGRFQFVTENHEGREVSVNGSLNFPSGKALTGKKGSPFWSPLLA